MSENPSLNPTNPSSSEIEYLKKRCELLVDIPTRLATEIAKDLERQVKFMDLYLADLESFIDKMHKTNQKTKGYLEE